MSREILVKDAESTMKLNRIGTRGEYVLLTLLAKKGGMDVEISIPLDAADAAVVATGLKELTKG